MFVSHSNPNKILIFFITFIEFFISICVIHFIIILFGASIDDFLNTLMFSSLLSMICVMPCLILIDHSDPTDLLFRIFIKQEVNTSNELICAQIAKGTIVGTWFGALVIPLDWDKWWQVFPIPCIIGAFFGTFVSSLNILYKSKTKLKIEY